MKGVVLVLALGLCCVLATDVCKEVSQASDRMVSAQKLEGEFIADIEVVNKEDSKVQNLRIYYSQPAKTIRLDVLDNRAHHTYYFYFEYDEILKFEYGPGLGRGHCDVYTDLSKTVDEFWFGGTTKGAQTPTIPAPLAVLHFTGKSGFSDHALKQKYIGKQKVRGKTANMYTSCQKFSSQINDIVVNMTHNFAEESFAFPYIDHIYSTLLSVDMKGNGKVNGVADKTIDHTYNYFNFRGFEKYDTSLETPEGIVCKGRKPNANKKFPPLPNVIKFTGEVVDHGDKQFLAKEEVYDYYHRYAIIKTVNKVNSEDDLNRITAVFDFPADKLYMIDNVETSCQIQNITSHPKNLDLYKVKGGNVSMDSPSSFFMANPTDFTYLGQKRIRGMTTDVWVAPSNVQTGGTVQFHFAPPTSSWNDQFPAFTKNKWPVPVKITVWTNDDDTNPQVENIFHVDYNALRPDYLDMAPCYTYRYHMQIVVKGTRKSIVDSYEAAFLYEVRVNVAQVATVSMHEIAQMKIFYHGDNAYIEFLVGGEDKNKLKKAVQKISDVLSTGKLVLTVRAPGSTVWAKGATELPFVKVASVDVNAAEQAKHSSKDSGFSKGSMAGLGVAMVIVGLAGGAGVGYAHGKYFG